VFARKLILAIVWNVLCFGGTLFWGAHTFHWWRAWVFVGVVVVATVATMVGVLRDRPELMRERFKGLIQRGQPWIDRLVVLVFAFSFGVLFWLIPTDVFELHTFPKPGVLVSSLGLAMYIAGWWIIALTFQANAFAIPVIKHQKERGHVVVDSGVYAAVRHPMYVGVILMMFGMPLWLESYAGALWAMVPTAALATRILVEERFLRRELTGYEAYTERVRYRLLPFIW
jgi:protein-S-isoprenylcysteine O-methyltransferase Ste14